MFSSTRDHNFEPASRELYESGNDSINFAHAFVVVRFIGYKTRVLAPKNTGLVFYKLPTMRRS